MIVLAYLWLLALVPLLFEKHDPDIQWHAKHGIVLMLAELILFFGYIMVTSLVSLATLGLGCVDSAPFFANQPAAACGSAAGGSDGAGGASGAAAVSDSGAPSLGGAG